MYVGISLTDNRQLITDNLHSALVLTHFGIFRQTHVTKGSKQYK